MFGRHLASQCSGIGLVVALVVLAGSAAPAAPLPKREPLPSISSPGAAVLAQTMLVKLDAVRGDVSRRSEVWESLVEDAGLLAESTGAQVSRPSGRMAGNLFLIQGDHGWSAGPDADLVIARWLSQVADDSNYSLSGYFPAYGSSRPGLQRLAGQSKVFP